MKRRLLLATLAALFLALPVLADDVIYGGTDLWITPVKSGTFADFAAEPLPAGFFCERSQPFTGRISFKGVPIATDDPGVLRQADTVIERLDNAEFDEAGVAETRLQVRALNLASVQPIRTACGDYNVRATLVGNQPTTRMRIFREGEDGGRFLAPLALNVKLTFTPVGRGRAVEFVHKVRLGADPRATWTVEANNKRGAYVKIDSDGDGRADAFVPGPSNFRAGGMRPSDKLIQSTTTISREDQLRYHTNPTHAHGIQPIESELSPTQTVN